MNHEPRQSPLAVEDCCVKVPAVGVIMEGRLALPEDASGIVICTGIDDYERRNNRKNNITEGLNRYKLGTLSLEFPASTHMTSWAKQNSHTAALPLGFFSSGGDVVSALITASQEPEDVKALVLCGGEPDLAADFLPLVKAPVLLIAAGHDSEGLQSCRAALAKLSGPTSLNVIPKASPSFREPGALEDVVQLAAVWFSQHLA